MSTGARRQILGQIINNSNGEPAHGNRSSNNTNDRLLSSNVKSGRNASGSCRGTSTIDGSGRFERLRSDGNVERPGRSTVMVARKLDWGRDEDSSSTDDSAYQEEGVYSPSAAPPPPQSLPPPPPTPSVGANHHPNDHLWRSLDPLLAAPSSPNDWLVSGGSPAACRVGSDHGNNDDSGVAHRCDDGARLGDSDAAGRSAAADDDDVDDDDDENKATSTPCRPKPRWAFHSRGSPSCTPGEVRRSRHPDSPPHKTLHKLRLMDSPHSPKSLQELALAGAVSRAGGALRGSTPKREPRVNFNPFTPACREVLQSCLQRGRKREIDGDLMDGMFEDDCPYPPKRIMTMHEAEMESRFSTEFHELEALGRGHFGTVSRCVKRLDGCVYAVKRSRKPVARSADEQSALREVCAHAVLGQHPHVVRYYSAWAEDNHMYIQNEYCSGGSVAEALWRCAGGAFPECRVRTMALQVARGLSYIHGLGLVHMDIKPSNIFISRRTASSEPEEWDPPSGAENTEAAQDIFKIGDLGHVTRVNSTSVEEGDSRFLAHEVLQQDFSELPRADVFALALSAAAAAGGGPLPRNGAKWLRIRQGHLPEGPAMAALSSELRALLTAMLNPDARARPSAAELCCHPVLCGAAVSSVQSLRHALSCERLKNAHLRRELQLLTSKQHCATEHKRGRSRFSRSSSLTR